MIGTTGRPAGRVSKVASKPDRASWGILWLPLRQVLPVEASSVPQTRPAITRTQFLSADHPSPAVCVNAQVLLAAFKDAGVTERKINYVF